MEESQIIVVNATLYVSLFIFLFLKYKWRNISVILSFLYAVSSIGSLFLYNFPLYDLTISSQGKITLSACIYLFILNFLLITAFCKCNIDKCIYITDYNNNYILKWIKFLIIIFSVYLLFSLPLSIADFFSNKELSDLRDATYESSSSQTVPFIISLISRIFGGLIVVLLCFVSIRVLLLKKYTKWDKYGIIIYAIWKFNTILSMVSRATIVFSLLEIIVLLCLTYSYLSDKLKKKLVVVAIVLGSTLFLVFTTITISRFSSGDKNDLMTEFSSVRYLGESQLNFMGLAYPNIKEPFKGYSMFSLYRRMLGMDYNDGSTRDDGSIYDSYIQKKYRYNYPTYIFYGLSGEYYMNFGYWGALMICGLIFYCMRKQYSNFNRQSMIGIVVTVTLASYVGKGVFYADYSNESGNLMILFLILMYLILKNNGKKQLVSHNN